VTRCRRRQAAPRQTGRGQRLIRPEAPGLELPSSFEAAFLESAQRLHAAGLIESVVHDSLTGTGVVTFTSACLELMLAGRWLFSEPAFLAVWESRDPTLVRTWIEHEAARLQQQHPRNRIG
jgi:hypothetical protein